MIKALVALVLALHAGACLAVPCFPGAEGFGTETPGGRGGRIIIVTNLADDGPGSLRAACEAKGPRTVVFGVGGTIRLKKALRITEPFITIAGQTAPGAGVCLRDAVLVVQTHDVVIRFIRVRVGPSLVEEFDEQNTIEITGQESYNIVVDHCSFSWSIDENVGIVSGAHDVTFSYNIISEPLRQPFSKFRIGKERSHSMGMILGNHPNRCSVHHNLIAHSNSRNPRIQGGTHDFVNNVVYDWGFLSGTFSREPNVNFIGNYYKAGPSSNPIKAICQASGKVYVKGNRSPDRTTDDMPEWEPITDADPALYRSTEPFPTAPLTITTAEQAYLDVLAGAGCRLPELDAVDKRIIRQVSLGMGGKIDLPGEVGGYPDLPYVVGRNDWGQTDAGSMERYMNGLVEAWASETPKVVTYPVPDPATDSPYGVAVNGRVVPVEKAGTIDGAYYARFQFTKIARVTVTLDGAGEMKLDPPRYRDGVTSEPGMISFDVSQGGPRVITSTLAGKKVWPLIVIADDHDNTPAPSGPAVFNVSDFGLPANGTQTRQLQSALDACAARQGGGVVFFGPGVYRTGTLRIKDNTTVYLAPGALIQASTDPKDFPVDEGRTEEGTHGKVCSFSRLIIFDRCVNSSLIGYGVIDGMGHIIRNKHGRHVQLVDVTGSRNIRISDIVLRNSAEWTLHILGSRRVSVHNLKILNDWAVSNTDGIDPDGSRDVRITRYFGFCGDDAVAIKTTGNSDFTGPAVNVEVKDSVVMTRKTSYKIGTETYSDIHDVLFQDCDAVNSSRGIAIWMEDGAAVSDVTYRDMRLDLREFGGERYSGEPIRVNIGTRHGMGSVRNVLFDRVTAISPYKSQIQGLPESKLENFNFWGCRFVVKPREMKMGKQPVVDIRDARGFTFKYAYVDWLAHDEANWDGFIGQRDSEGIFVREVKETHDVR